MKPIKGSFWRRGFAGLELLVLVVLLAGLAVGIKYGVGRNQAPKTTLASGCFCTSGGQEGYSCVPNAGDCGNSGGWACCGGSTPVDQAPQGPSCAENINDSCGSAGQGFCTRCNGTSAEYFCKDPAVGSGGGCVAPSTPKADASQNTSSEGTTVIPDPVGTQYGVCSGDSLYACGSDGKETKCVNNRWESTGNVCSTPGDQGNNHIDSATGELVDDTGAVVTTTNSSSTSDSTATTTQASINTGWCPVYDAANRSTLHGYVPCPVGNTSLYGTYAQVQALRYGVVVTDVANANASLQNSATLTLNPDGTIQNTPMVEVVDDDGQTSVIDFSAPSGYEGIYCGGCGGFKADPSGPGCNAQIQAKITANACFDGNGTLVTELAKSSVGAVCKNPDGSACAQIGAASQYGTKTENGVLLTYVGGQWQSATQILASGTSDPETCSQKYGAQSYVCSQLVAFQQPNITTINNLLTAASTATNVTSDRIDGKTAQQWVLEYATANNLNVTPADLAALAAETSNIILQSYSLTQLNQSPAFNAYITCLETSTDCDHAEEDVVNDPNYLALSEANKKRVLNEAPKIAAANVQTQQTGTNYLNAYISNDTDAISKACLMATGNYTVCSIPDRAKQALAEYLDINYQVDTQIIDAQLEEQRALSRQQAAAAALTMKTVLDGVGGGLTQQLNQSNVIFNSLDATQKAQALADAQRFNEAQENYLACKSFCETHLLTMRFLAPDITTDLFIKNLNDYKNLSAAQNAIAQSGSTSRQGQINAQLQVASLSEDQRQIFNQISYDINIVSLLSSSPTTQTITGECMRIYNSRERCINNQSAATQSLISNIQDPALRQVAATNYIQDYLYQINLARLQNANQDQIFQESDIELQRYAWAESDPTSNTSAINIDALLTSLKVPPESWDGVKLTLRENFFTQLVIQNYDNSEGFACSEAVNARCKKILADTQVLEGQFDQDVVNQAYILAATNIANRLVDNDYWNRALTKIQVDSDLESDYLKAQVNSNLLQQTGRTLDEWDAYREFVSKWTYKSMTPEIQADIDRDFRTGKFKPQEALATLESQLSWKPENLANIAVIGLNNMFQGAPLVGNQILNQAVNDYKASGQFEKDLENRWLVDYPGYLIDSAIKLTLGNDALAVRHAIRLDKLAYSFVAAQFTQDPIVESEFRSRYNAVRGALIQGAKPAALIGVTVASLGIAIPAIATSGSFIIPVSMQYLSTGFNVYAAIGSYADTARACEIDAFTTADTGWACGGAALNSTFLTFSAIVSTANGQMQLSSGRTVNAVAANITRTNDVQQIIADVLSSADDLARLPSLAKLPAPIQTLAGVNNIVGLLNFGIQSGSACGQMVADFNSDSALSCTSSGGMFLASALRLLPTPGWVKILGQSRADGFLGKVDIVAEGADWVDGLGSCYREGQFVLDAMCAEGFIDAVSGNDFGTNRYFDYLTSLPKTRQTLEQAAIEHANFFDASGNIKPQLIANPIIKAQTDLNLGQARAKLVAAGTNNLLAKTTLKEVTTHVENYISAKSKDTVWAKSLTQYVQEYNADPTEANEAKVMAALSIVTTQNRLLDFDPNTLTGVPQANKAAIANAQQALAQAATTPNFDQTAQDAYHQATTNLVNQLQIGLAKNHGPLGINILADALNIDIGANNVAQRLVTKAQQLDKRIADLQRRATAINTAAQAVPAGPERQSFENEAEQVENQITSAVQDQAELVATANAISPDPSITSPSQPANPQTPESIFEQARVQMETAYRSDPNLPITSGNTIISNLASELVRNGIGPQERRSYLERLVELRAKLRVQPQQPSPSLAEDSGPQEASVAGPAPILTQPLSGQPVPQQPLTNTQSPAAAVLPPAPAAEPITGLEITLPSSGPNYTLESKFTSGGGSGAETYLGTYQGKPAVIKVFPESQDADRGRAASLLRPFKGELYPQVYQYVTVTNSEGKSLPALAIEYIPGVELGSFKGSIPPQVIKTARDKIKRFLSSKSTHRFGDLAEHNILVIVDENGIATDIRLVDPLFPTDKNPLQEFDEKMVGLGFIAPEVLATLDADAPPSQSEQPEPSTVTEGPSPTQTVVEAIQTIAGPISEAIIEPTAQNIVEVAAPVVAQASPLGEAVDQAVKALTGASIADRVTTAVVARTTKVGPVDPHWAGTHVLDYQDLDSQAVSYSVYTQTKIGVYQLVAANLDYATARNHTGPETYVVATYANSPKLLFHKRYDGGQLGFYGGGFVRENDVFIDTIVDLSAEASRLLTAIGIPQDQQTPELLGFVANRIYDPLHITPLPDMPYRMTYFLQQVSSTAQRVYSSFALPYLLHARETIVDTLDINNLFGANQVPTNPRNLAGDYLIRTATHVIVDVLGPDYSLVRAGSGDEYIILSKRGPISIEQQQELRIRIAEALASQKARFQGSNGREVERNIGVDFGKSTPQASSAVSEFTGDLEAPKKRIRDTHPELSNLINDISDGKLLGMIEKILYDDLISNITSRIEGQCECTIHNFRDRSDFIHHVQSGYLLTVDPAAILKTLNDTSGYGVGNSFIQNYAEQAILALAQSGVKDISVMRRGSQLTFALGPSANISDIQQAIQNALPKTYAVNDTVLPVVTGIGLVETKFSRDTTVKAQEFGAVQDALAENLWNDQIANLRTTVTSNPADSNLQFLRDFLDPRQKRGLPRLAKLKAGPETIATITSLFQAQPQDLVAINKTLIALLGGNDPTIPASTIDDNPDNDDSGFDDISADGLPIIDFTPPSPRQIFNGIYAWVTNATGVIAQNYNSLAFAQPELTILLEPVGRAGSFINTWANRIVFGGAAAMSDTLIYIGEYIDEQELRTIDQEYVSVSELSSLAISNTQTVINRGRVAALKQMNQIVGGVFGQITKLANIPTSYTVQGQSTASTVVKRPVMKLEKDMLNRSMRNPKEENITSSKIRLGNGFNIVSADTNLANTLPANFPGKHPAQDWVTRDRDPGRFMVDVVSDGVSSDPNSVRVSRLANQVAQRETKKLLAQGYSPTEAIKQAVSIVKQEIAQLSGGEGSTTINITVIDLETRTLTAGNIGDSPILLVDDDTGEIKFVSHWGRKGGGQSWITWLASRAKAQDTNLAFAEIEKQPGSNGTNGLTNNTNEEELDRLQINTYPLPYNFTLINASDNLIKTLEDEIFITPKGAIVSKYLSDLLKKAGNRPERAIKAIAEYQLGISGGDDFGIIITKVSSSPWSTILSDFLLPLPLRLTQNLWNSIQSRLNLEPQLSGSKEATSPQAEIVHQVDELLIDQGTTTSQTVSTQNLLDLSDKITTAVDARDSETLGVERISPSFNLSPIAATTTEPISVYNALDNRSAFEIKDQTTGQSLYALTTVAETGSNAWTLYLINPVTGEVLLGEPTANSRSGLPQTGSKITTPAFTIEILPSRADEAEENGSLYRLVGDMRVSLNGQDQNLAMRKVPTKMIREALDIPKGTYSDWLENTIYPPITAEEIPVLDASQVSPTTSNTPLTTQEEEPVLPLAELVEPEPSPSNPSLGVAKLGLTIAAPVVDQAIEVVEAISDVVTPRPKVGPLSSPETISLSQWTDGVISIGRSSAVRGNADIQTREWDRSISRNHALITKQGDRYYIANADSKSGTLLVSDSGATLLLQKGSGTVPLENGDKIFVGDAGEHFTYNDGVLTGPETDFDAYILAKNPVTSPPLTPEQSSPVVTVTIPYRNNPTLNGRIALALSPSSQDQESDTGVDYRIFVIERNGSRSYQHDLSYYLDSQTLGFSNGQRVVAISSTGQTAVFDVQGDNLVQSLNELDALTIIPVGGYLPGIPFNFTDFDGLEIEFTGQQGQAPSVTIVPQDGQPQTIVLDRSPRTPIKIGDQVIIGNTAFTFTEIDGRPYALVTPNSNVVPTESETLPTTPLPNKFSWSGLQAAFWDESIFIPPPKWALEFARNKMEEMFEPFAQALLQPGNTVKMTVTYVDFGHTITANVPRDLNALKYSLANIAPQKNVKIKIEVTQADGRVVTYEKQGNSFVQTSNNISTESQSDSTSNQAESRRVSRRTFLGYLGIGLGTLVTPPAVAAAIAYYNNFVNVQVPPKPTFPSAVVQPISTTEVPTQQPTDTVQPPTQEVAPTTAVKTEQQLVQERFAAAPSYISYLFANYLQTVVIPNRQARSMIEGGSFWARLGGSQMTEELKGQLINNPILHLVILGADIGESRGDMPFNTARSDQNMDVYINLETGEINIITPNRDIILADGNTVNPNYNYLNTTPFTIRQDVALPGVDELNPDAPLKNAEKRWEAMTGVPVDGVIFANFEGFTTLIDELYPDGLTMDIPMKTYNLNVANPEDVNGPIVTSHEPGQYTLKGYQALNFVRERHGSSTQSREQRLRMVMEAIIKDQIRVAAIEATLPGGVQNSINRIQNVLLALTGGSRDVLTSIDLFSGDPQGQASGITAEMEFQDALARKNVNPLDYAQKIATSLAEMDVDSFGVGPQNDPFGSAEYPILVANGSKFVFPSFNGNFSDGEWRQDLNFNPSAMDGPISYYTPYRKIVKEVTNTNVVTNNNPIVSSVNPVLVPSLTSTVYSPVGAIFVILNFPYILRDNIVPLARTVNNWFYTARNQPQYMVTAQTDKAQLWANNFAKAATNVYSGKSVVQFIDSTWANLSPNTQRTVVKVLLLPLGPIFNTTDPVTMSAERQQTSSWWSPLTIISRWRFERTLSSLYLSSELKNNFLAKARNSKDPQSAIEGTLAILQLGRKVGRFEANAILSALIESEEPIDQVAPVIGRILKVNHPKNEVFQASTYEFLIKSNEVIENEAVINSLFTLGQQLGISGHQTGDFLKAIWGHKDDVNYLAILPKAAQQLKSYEAPDQAIMYAFRLIDLITASPTQADLEYRIIALEAGVRLKAKSITRDELSFLLTGDSKNLSILSQILTSLAESSGDYRAQALMVFVANNPRSGPEWLAGLEKLIPRLLNLDIDSQQFENLLRILKQAKDARSFDLMTNLFLKLQNSGVGAEQSSRAMESLISHYSVSTLSDIPMATTLTLILNSEASGFEVVRLIDVITNQHYTPDQLAVLVSNYPRLLRAINQIPFDQSIGYSEKLADYYLGRASLSTEMTSLVSEVVQSIKETPNLNSEALTELIDYLTKLEPNQIASDKGVIMRSIRLFALTGQFESRTSLYPHPLKVFVAMAKGSPNLLVNIEKAVRITQNNPQVNFSPYIYNLTPQSEDQAHRMARLFAARDGKVVIGIINYGIKHGFSDLEINRLLDAIAFFVYPEDALALLNTWDELNWNPDPFNAARLLARVQGLVVDQTKLGDSIVMLRNDNMQEIIELTRTLSSRGLQFSEFYYALSSFSNPLDPSGLPVLNVIISQLPSRIQIDDIGGFIQSLGKVKNTKLLSLLPKIILSLAEADHSINLSGLGRHIELLGLTYDSNEDLDQLEKTLRFVRSQLSDDPDFQSQVVGIILFRVPNVDWEETYPEIVAKLASAKLSQFNKLAILTVISEVAKSRQLPSVDKLINVLQVLSSRQVPIDAIPSDFFEKIRVSEIDSLDLETLGNLVTLPGFFEPSVYRSVLSHLPKLREKSPHQARTYVSIMTQIDQSPSTLIQHIKNYLIDQLLATPDPQNAYSTIETIFLRNNLPFFMKLTRVFDTLYNQDLLTNTITQYPNISPVLRTTTSDSQRRFLLKRDILRATVESGNRELKNYLVTLVDFTKISDKLRAGKKLSTQEQEQLARLLLRLDALYRASNLIHVRDQVIDDPTQLTNDDYLRQKVDQVYTDLRVAENQSLEDRLGELFLANTGYHSLNQLIKEIDQARNKADATNRKAATNTTAFTAVKGDLLKGVLSESKDYTLVNILGILQEGLRAREFMGDGASSDHTPLDTDVSRVLAEDADEGLEKAIQQSLTKNGKYGDLILLIKNTEDKFFQSDQGERASTPKYELFKTGYADKNRHYGIRGAFPSTDIDALIVTGETAKDKRKLELLYGAVVRNGFYIPVIDIKGGILFTPEMYDARRSFYSGLPQFEGDQLTIIPLSPIDLFSRLIENSNFVTTFEESALRVKQINESVYGTVREVLAKYGVTLVTNSQDAELRDAVLYNIGSSGRNTNLPGDYDFDYTLLLNVQDFQKVAQISQDLRATLPHSGEITADIQDEHLQIRLLGVTLPGVDTPFALDIGLNLKGDFLLYSSDQAVQDRLASLSESDRKAAISNIQLAKKLLKEGKAYKKGKGGSEWEEGGLGGIGVENWLLANHGNIREAFQTFWIAAHDDSGNIRPLSDFQASYPIYDPGVNLKFKEFDNYTRLLSENGYQKMLEIMEPYIASLPPQSAPRSAQAVGFSFFGQEDPIGEALGDFGNKYIRPLWLAPLKTIGIIYEDLQGNLQWKWPWQKTQSTLPSITAEEIQSKMDQIQSNPEFQASLDKFTLGIKNGLNAYSWRDTLVSGFFLIDAQASDWEADILARWIAIKQAVEDQVPDKDGQLASVRDLPVPHIIQINSIPTLAFYLPQSNNWYTIYKNPDGIIIASLRNGTSVYKNYLEQTTVQLSILDIPDNPLSSNIPESQSSTPLQTKQDQGITSNHQPQILQRRGETIVQVGTVVFYLDPATGKIAATPLDRWAGNIRYPAAKYFPALKDPAIVANEYPIEIDRVLYRISTQGNAVVLTPIEGSLLVLPFFVPEQLAESENIPNGYQPELPKFLRPSLWTRFMNWLDPQPEFMGYENTTDRHINDYLGGLFPDSPTNFAKSQQRAEDTKNNEHPLPFPDTTHRVWDPANPNETATIPAKEHFGGIPNFFAAGKVVVDLGTGEGLALRELAQEYPQTTFIGIDLNYDRVRKPNLSQKGVQFTKDDWDSLATLPDHSVDSFISMFGAFTHGDDLEKVVLAITRVAKSGAILRAIDAKEGTEQLLQKNGWLVYKADGRTVAEYKGVVAQSQTTIFESNIGKIPTLSKVANPWPGFVRKALVSLGVGTTIGVTGGAMLGTWLTSQSSFWDIHSAGVQATIQAPSYATQQALIPTSTNNSAVQVTLEYPDRSGALGSANWVYYETDPTNSDNVLVYAATAAHVIHGGGDENKTPVRVQVNQPQLDKTPWASNSVGFAVSDNQQTPDTGVIVIRVPLDIFQAPNSPFSGILELDQATDWQPNDQEDLYVVGFPDLDPQGQVPFSSIIRLIPTSNGSFLDSDGFYRASSVDYSGASGSVVTTKDGKIIGVISQMGRGLGNPYIVIAPLTQSEFLKLAEEARQKLPLPPQSSTPTRQSYAEGVAGRPPQP